ncbi:aldo/keto reductase [Spiractinospora alimapuensis]|uniref:aldo/keto reductase n=1 Tax=Spiractinospora alimapuensis TaxID=2820884 RepID=UPI001F4661FB|nr:aldo/keto reductase [Spiractinospora alimapuensis]QVQ50388.1 aldo/keto reductase [Spiractinospora alimapuensis]
MQYITLNNGLRMPQLGFGVFQVPDDEAERSVDVALQAGYRSIDTAALYQNEEGVGRAVRASGIDREELFVTTKLWNTDQGYENTLDAFDASLRKLGMDYVDLYLIHWPSPARNLYVDTWQALERIYSEGRAKAIGVSNFTEETLDRVVKETEIVPAVNQIELHPYLTQERMRAADANHGVATEAWSPLGQGKGLLDDPTLATLARKHGRSPAQVVLRWHIQLGNIVIPKSVTPERIRENLNVFGFELDDEDMATINGLNRDERVGPDPETFNK